MQGQTTDEAPTKPLDPKRLTLMCGYPERYCSGVSERVDRLDVGTRWEPNAPDAVLVADDQGTVVLALNAHPEDEDHRAITLVWSGAHSATMGDPNDEAISGHRLYRTGLDAVHWAGVVHGSELIADLEARNRVHPGHDARQYGDLRHYVLPLKECVVEVVATHLTMSRVEGSTKQAVATVL